MNGMLRIVGLTESACIPYGKYSSASNFINCSAVRNDKSDYGDVLHAVKRARETMMRPRAVTAKMIVSRTNEKQANRRKSREPPTQRGAQLIRLVPAVIIVIVRKLCKILCIISGVIYNRLHRTFNRASRPYAYIFIFYSPFIFESPIFPSFFFILAKIPGAIIFRDDFPKNREASRRTLIFVALIRRNKRGILPRAIIGIVRIVARLI